MDEYIEREVAVKAFNNFDAGRADNPPFTLLTPEEFAEYLYELPAADVAPVVHARWIHSRYEDCSEQFELVKCSQCNHEAYAMAFYVRGGNYCPNCGAKMDGGDNDAAD